MSLTKYSTAASPFHPQVRLVILPSQKTASTYGIGTDIPRPHGHGVPFFYFKAGRRRRRFGGDGRRLFGGLGLSLCGKTRGVREYYDRTTKREVETVGRATPPPWSSPPQPTIDRAAPRQHFGMRHSHHHTSATSVMSAFLTSSDDMMMRSVFQQGK